MNQAGRTSGYFHYQKSLDETRAPAPAKVAVTSPRQKDLPEVKVLGGPPYPLDSSTFIPTDSFLAAYSAGCQRTDPWLSESTRSTGRAPFLARLPPPAAPLRCPLTPREEVASISADVTSALSSAPSKG